MQPEARELRRPRRAARRQRAPQQRAEDTRNALIDEATRAFAAAGYDGVSLRTLEQTSSVQRGAVAYHFGDKEGLWRAVVDRLLARLAAHFEALDGTIRDLEPALRVRVAVTALVRFSAENPELNRLMVQEGAVESSRLEYILDSGLRPRLAWLAEVTGRAPDAHFYYGLLGAASLVFTVGAEAHGLFGVDPASDEFIREHAVRVADMALAMQAGDAS